MAWGLVSSQPRATGPRGAWARLLSLSAEADLLAFFPNNHFDFCRSNVCEGELGRELDVSLSVELGDEGLDRADFLEESLWPSLDELHWWWAWQWQCLCLGAGGGLAGACLQLGRGEGGGGGRLTSPSTRSYELLRFSELASRAIAAFMLLLSFLRVPSGLTWNI